MLYIATIFSVESSKVTLKCARKYGERDGKITSTWPDLDDFVHLDNTSSEKVSPLPDPMIDRRGTSMTFKTKAFGKMNLGDIM